MIVRDLLEEGTLVNPLLHELLVQEKINALKDLEGLKKFEIVN
jgi:hypothetical protein